MKKPWEFESPVCAEVGTELFYLEEELDVPQSFNDYQKAKSLCDTCVHQEDCAEWGILMETHGIWGGLTPKERQLIRRRRRIYVRQEKNLV